MQIQLVHNRHYYLDGYCGACGELFTPEAVIAIAYSHSGAEIGIICDQCLQAERAGLRQRIRRQAAALRQRAAALDRLAEEEVLLPSRADWHALGVSSYDAVTGDDLTGLWYESLNRMKAV